MYELFLQGNYLAILVVILISSIAIESLITLIKDSDISQWLIHPTIITRYEQNQTWYNLTLYKWITCGHCMSFIYSFPFAIAISVFMTGPWSFLLIWLALQRLSNWFNVAYKLLAHGRVTAIEFVTPLIGVTPEMSTGNYFEDAKEREFRRGSLQRTRVNTLSDIQRVIRSTSTEHNRVKNATVLVDGKPVVINTATNHPSYMTMIKEMLLEEQQLEEPTEPLIINGEQVIPLNVQASTSVEKIIEQFTGGVRDGDRIKWELNDGSVYFYNPITEKLTKLDG